MKIDDLKIQELKTYFQKAVTDKTLNNKEISLIIREISQCFISGKDFKNTGTDKTMREAIDLLRELVVLAFNSNTNAVVMVPMASDLLAADKQTIDVLIDYLNDSIHLHDLPVEDDSKLSDEEKWAKYNRQSLGYTFTERYAEGLAVGNKALELAKTIFKPDDIRIADSLKNVALAYLYSGKNEEAMKFVDEASLLVEKSFEQDKDIAAEVHHQYGAMLHAMRKYDEAEAQYNKGLRLRRELKNGALIAKSLGDLARLYGDVNPSSEKPVTLYEEAQKNLAEFLKTAKPQNDRYAEAQLDSSILANNLGYSYMTEDEYDKSIEYFTMAVDNLEKYVAGGDTINPGFLRNIVANINDLYVDVPEKDLERVEKLLERMEKFVVSAAS